MLRESDIVHECGNYWVLRADSRYTVYRNGATHATADSAYKGDADGLSLAIARCNYLAKRERDVDTPAK